MDRKTQDQAITERLAVEIAPYIQNVKIENLQESIESADSEYGGRVIVLDYYGKVLADSYSVSNGTRLELPEVVSILSGEKLVDYGVHQIEGNQTKGFFSFFTPIDQDAQWVGYSTTLITYNSTPIGVLVFSSSIQQMMQRLVTLQSNMAKYFIIAAVIAMIIALVLSRVITKPIVLLTKSIKKMGKGDLSARVPVSGSSEMKRLSETFNAMSEKLEMLDNSRNQFVSNASHELKTPLATMKILMESIIYQPEMETELRTEFLTDINKEIDRLSLIISDLLTLVSMDSKTMRLNRETFKLAQVVRDVTHRLSVVAEKKNQNIIVQISDNCEMYADCAKLTQVVLNLLDNAIKYSPENGTIKVRLIRSGKDAILSITDNGAGIPQKDLAHIFDRFYRVDKARSRDTGGTGLGLSIVNQMILMHGGNVSVQSEEGKGSTFTVELPIHLG